MSLSARTVVMMCFSAMMIVVFILNGCRKYGEKYDVDVLTGTLIRAGWQPDCVL